jgi:endonuclease/exonuclease/phosphatase family metal-dependent hydrolase
MSLIRILCFNIHGGYSRDGKRDLRRVNALMDELDIDIGCFQEMETRPSRGGKSTDIDVLAGMSRPYHLPGPTMKEGLGWFGNLLVSRYPIVRAMAHSMEPTYDFEPRNAVDATIDTPFGRIRVINTHLSLSPFERKLEVPMLIKLIKDVEEEEPSPVFLMGDMNEWRPKSKLLKFLDGQLVPVPCGPTFPAGWPFLRLDRVWHDSPKMKVTARVLTEKNVSILSDHLPLLIEIEKMMP